MAEPIILNARIKQADVTQPEWVAKNPVLLLNEFYFILNEDGLAVGIIRGDGVKRLNEIPVNYFGTGTGEGWEPTLDNEPLSGSINYVNSGKLYLWGEKFVVKETGKGLSKNNFTDEYKDKLDELSEFNLEYDTTPTPASGKLVTSGNLYTWGQNFVVQDGDKVLSDNNFSDADKEKLDNLEDPTAPSFSSITGVFSDNASLAAEISALWDAINTKTTLADVTAEVMSKAYYEPTSGNQLRYDRYRVYGSVTSPISGTITDTVSSPYTPKVYAQGTIFLDVGASMPPIPAKMVKVQGDEVLNTVNVINYVVISSTRIEYSIYPLLMA